MSFAAAGLTEVITNVFDLGAGASGAIEAVIRTAIAIVCLKIVIKRVAGRCKLMHLPACVELPFYVCS